MKMMNMVMGKLEHGINKTNNMKQFKNILAVMMMAVTLSLASCGSDNDGEGPDGDDSIESLIIGTWECKHNANEKLVYTFHKDGSFESLSYDYGEIYEEDGYYTINGKTVILSYGGDVESFEVKSTSRNKIVVNYDGRTLTFNRTSDATDDGDDDDDYDDDDNIPSDELSKKFIGEWWKGNILDSRTQRFFCPNGKGYDIMTKRDNDFGIRYIAFTWRVESEDILYIHFEDDSKETQYIYSLENDNLKLGDYAVFKKMDSKVDETFDTSKKPFANYIKDDIGYYYEIAKMTSGVRHATGGENMNERFLHFFGSNELLKPTGLRVAYYTPRWDGIDSEWSSGTYTISQPSGAYKYIALGWCDGLTLDAYDNDKLKISKNGSVTTYDYVGRRFELHVNVISK